MILMQRMRPASPNATANALHSDGGDRRVARSTRSYAIAMLLGAALGSVGCGNPGGTAPNVGAGGTGSAISPAQQDSRAENGSNADQPENSGGGDSTPMRTYFDLAAHHERGELRRGRSLLIDFGTKGAAKYTLGGWRTRTRQDRKIDGHTTLGFGEVGDLLLPAESRGPATLVLRAAAFAADVRISVHINGERVGYLRLPPVGSLGVVQLELDAGTLDVGDNVITMRADLGSVPRSVRKRLDTIFAIDWLALVPEGEAVPGETDTPPIVAVAGEGGKPELALAADHSFGFTLRVPAGGRLRAQVASASSDQASRPDAERKATIEGSQAASALGVRIIREKEKAPTTIAESALGQALDVDLTPFEGELVRLELEGRSALRLLHPVVAVKAAPASQGGEEAEKNATPRASRARNVLVYLIDTLRADKLRPYNQQSRVETPGLERYVQHATLFEQGFTQENWTKPSVATLLSGLLPWQHRAMDGESTLPASVAILPEIFRKEGFETAGFVCNGYVSRPFGFERGWGRFKNYIKEGQRTQARFVASDVLAWLDQRDKDKPFFLYVHTIDPHVPYIPPPETLQRYDPSPYSGPVDFTRDRLLLEKVKGKRVRLNDRDRKRLEALYDGEISYHDVHMAAILEGLERRQLSEETLVVITADHGEEFFDHDSVGHGHSLYQELLRVPFIIRVPGLSAASSRITESVGLVDIAPTIADAVGVTLPDKVAGRSLLPLLRGEKDSAPRVMVAGSNDAWRAIIVDDLKLIQRTYDDVQIYDLRSDPAEKNNLANERPLALRYLRGLLGLSLVGTEGRTHRARATRIDAATEAQLRALGYAGASKK